MSKTDEWDETVSVLPGVIDDDTAPRHAYLVVVRGNNVGETFLITGEELMIGRGAGADLRVNDEGVSRFHCKLRIEGANVFVEDLSSRNGTYCNGVPVTPGMRALVEGDRLQVGTNYVLRFTYVQTDSGRISSPVVQEDIIDPLTGLASRRQLLDVLDLEFGSVKHQGLPLSLIVVHMDRYPDLVASRGQQNVDALTLAVAKCINECVYEGDFIGRIAGGDFALLVKRASPGDTFMLAERLRSSAKDIDGELTLSLGVAAVDELNAETAHELFVGASTALHRARSRGGNCAVLCTQELLREPKSTTRV